MATQLVAKAEENISGFFQSKNAMEQLKKLYEQTLQSVEKDIQISSNRVIEFTHSILDLALQKIIEKISWKLLKQEQLDENRLPFLLDFCIEGAQRKFLILSAPYKIFEDLMETQTISTCEKLWDLLETRKTKLTSSDFIPPAGKTNKASLCLLRMCNALLRRLSKTYNTVFCGRILMFLSFTFALSERSAVNLMGKSNIGNMTTFEDEDIFENAEKEIQHVPMDIDSSSANSGAAADTGPIDYNLYRIFWDIQRFFRQYHVVMDNPVEWDTFFEELNIVLSAFEGNAFSPDDLERSRELLLMGGNTSMNTITMNTKPSTEVDGAGNIHSNTGDTDNSSSSTTGEEHFFQPKYLTNSRLFRLQLKDPILRVCMLTQFLILLNTLSKVKAPEGTQTSKNQLEEIEQRVIRLLEQTPLDGQGASRMIQTVLERERNWTKWKADKCPPYEKFHHQVRPQLSPSSTNDGSTNTKKRKITDIDSSTSNGAVAIDTDGVIKTKRARQSGGTGGFGGTARGVNKRNSIALMDQILLESTASEDILKKLKANDRITAVPLKKYMARFTEAWDPENGIEKEYWPDKDKMFCWRTVRTCMKEKINFLELSVDGASAIVRGILKLPVEKIEIQKESEEVNEEQEEEQEEQEEGQIQEKLKEEQKETSNK